MDAVFDYRIPVLHPLAVHFPLALLLAAALAALIWMFRGTFFWRNCTAFLVFLNIPATIFAYLTGDTMEERSEGVPIVDDLVDLHEQMGLYTLIASALACAALGALMIHQRVNPAGEKDPIAGRVGVALIILTAAALVAWTAHIGATMTWGTAAF